MDLGDGSKVIVALNQAGMLGSRYSPAESLSDVHKIGGPVGKYRQFNVIWPVGDCAKRQKVDLFGSQPSKKLIRTRV